MRKYNLRFHQEVVILLDDLGHTKKTKFAYKIETGSLHDGFYI